MHKISVRSMAIDTIRLTCHLLSTLPHSISQLFEDLDSRVPVYASIGDAHSLLESRGTLCWDLLAAFVDV